MLENWSRDEDISMELETHAVDFTVCIQLWMINTCVDVSGFGQITDMISGD